MRIWIAGIVLAVSGPAPGVGAAPRVDPEVYARLQAEGRVRVVVRLAEWVVGDARLASSGRRRQRDRILARMRALEVEVEVGGPDVRVARRLRAHPFVALEVTTAGLARLARSAHATRVSLDRLGSPALAQSVPLIEGDEAFELGIRGAGQVVAILDTGIDGDHPALAGKLVGQACFASGSPFGSGGCPNGQSSHVGPGAGVPCDWGGQCGHGTAVAGIAVGAGATPGVAPEARVVSIQIYSRFSGASCGGGSDPCALTWSSDQAAALEHVYDVMRFDHVISVVNLSVATGAFASQASCDVGNAVLLSVVDALRDVGIAVVAAAGNQSEASAIGAPACLSSAVGVGAVTKADTIAAFSNRAPFLPFWAPGASVKAPRYFTSGTMSQTGTSFATPHVAGALVLMREAAPEAAMEHLIAILSYTGRPLPDPGSPTVRLRLRTALAEVLGACGDAFDNDGDGLANYPADPGCRDAFSTTESPACDDGIDNDGDGLVDARGLDLDGDGRFDGPGEAMPDAGCLGSPSRGKETASAACGLGFEIALMLIPAWMFRRRS